MNGLNKTYNVPEFTPAWAQLFESRLNPNPW